MSTPQQPTGSGPQWSPEAARNDGPHPGQAQGQYGQQPWGQPDPSAQDRGRQSWSQPGRTPQGAPATGSAPSGYGAPSGVGSQGGYPQAAPAQDYGHQAPAQGYGQAGYPHQAQYGQPGAAQPVASQPGAAQYGAARNAPGQQGFGPAGFGQAPAPAKGPGVIGPLTPRDILLLVGAVFSLIALVTPVFRLSYGFGDVGGTSSLWVWAWTPAMLCWLVLGMLGVIGAAVLTVLNKTVRGFPQRIGSFGIDQVISAATIVAAVTNLLFFVSSVTMFHIGGWFALLGSLIACFAGAFTMIPFLGREFTEREEVPAPLKARPVTHAAKAPAQQYPGAPAGGPFGSAPQQYGSNPQQYGSAPQQYGAGAPQSASAPQQYGSNPQQYAAPGQQTGSAPQGAGYAAAAGASAVAGAAGYAAADSAAPSTGDSAPEAAASAEAGGSTQVAGDDSQAYLGRSSAEAPEYAQNQPTQAYMAGSFAPVDEDATVVQPAIGSEQAPAQQDSDSQDVAVQAPEATDAGTPEEDSTGAEAATDEAASASTDEEKPADASAEDTQDGNDGAEAGLAGAFGGDDEDQATQAMSPEDVAKVREAGRRDSADTRVRGEESVEDPNEPTQLFRAFGSQEPTQAASAGAAYGAGAGQGAAEAPASQDSSAQESTSGSEDIEVPEGASPFWFAVPEPRDAIDPNTGAALFTVTPGEWFLALADQGNTFLVRNADGRQGILTNLEGIQRG